MVTMKSRSQPGASSRIVIGASGGANPRRWENGEGSLMPYRIILFVATRSFDRVTTHVIETRILAVEAKQSQQVFTDDFLCVEAGFDLRFQGARGDPVVNDVISESNDAFEWFAHSRRFQ